MAARKIAGAALCAVALCGSARAAEPPGPEALEALAAEVADSERAFARSLAEHRIDVFAALVAEDAVFRDNALRVGRAQVLAAWKPLFDRPDAPFSWAPDAVTVAASGTLAVSTGPVRDREGKLLGRFTTIWRRGADGAWQAIADQGAPLLGCEQAAGR